MAEAKRIQLTAVGPVQSKNKEKKEIPTLRFNLTLTKSTSKTCPEFSYTELTRNILNEAKENEEANPFLDPDDPLAVDDRDKMLALAKSFEEKYGSKPSKRRREERLEDLIDMGEGYDENDPFIDNTEAYDEIVPSCLTTKLGGFYINQGALDFRTLEEDESEADLKAVTKKKRKKIKRITSDEEGEGGIVKRGPKKRKSKDGEIKEKKKRKKSAGEMKGEELLKKIKRERGRPKKQKVAPSVADLLKQHEISPTSQGNTGGDTGSFSTGVHNGVTDPEEAQKIDSTIESVISQSLTLAQSEEEEGSQGDGQWSVPAVPGELAPRLPTGLSDDLENKIELIKKAAKQSTEGKCKFFSAAVNRLLLDIEQDTREISCSQRSGIYSHMATFLPCNKETLLKRVKKLKLNAQDDQLKDPINKLKEAIDGAMPALMDSYQAECAAAHQARLMEAKDKLESSKDEKPTENGAVVPSATGASTESDEDAEASQQGDKKRIMAPRKKFEWTESIRELLCRVVRLKLQGYESTRAKGQTAEEYLKGFLEAEIKTLWPKGWMQTRMLFKESKSAHSYLTGPQQKPKKTMIVTTSPKPQIVTSVAVVTTSTSVSSTVTAGTTVSQENKQIDMNTVPSSLGLGEQKRTDHAYSQRPKTQITTKPLTSTQVSELLRSSPASEVLKTLSLSTGSPAVSNTPVTAVVTSSLPGTVTNSSSDFMSSFQNFVNSQQSPQLSSQVQHPLTKSLFTLSQDLKNKMQTTVTVSKTKSKSPITVTWKGSSGAMKGQGHHLIKTTSSPGVYNTSVVDTTKTSPKTSPVAPLKGQNASIVTSSGQQVYIQRSQQPVQTNSVSSSSMQSAQGKTSHTANVASSLHKDQGQKAGGLAGPQGATVSPTHQGTKPKPSVPAAAAGNTVRLQQGQQSSIMSTAANLLDQKGNSVLGRTPSSSGRQGQTGGLQQDANHTDKVVKTLFSGDLITSHSGQEQGNSHRGGGDAVQQKTVSPQQQQKQQLQQQIQARLLQQQHLTEYQQADLVQQHLKAAIQQKQKHQQQKVLQQQQQKPSQQKSSTASQQEAKRKSSNEALLQHMKQQQMQRTLSAQQQQQQKSQSRSLLTGGTSAWTSDSAQQIYSSALTSPEVAPSQGLNYKSKTAAAAATQKPDSAFCVPYMRSLSSGGVPGVSPTLSLAGVTSALPGVPPSLTLAGAGGFDIVEYLKGSPVTPTSLSRSAADLSPAHGGQFGNTSPVVVQQTTPPRAGHSPSHSTPSPLHQQTSPLHGHAAQYGLGTPHMYPSIHTTSPLHHLPPNTLPYGTHVTADPAQGKHKY
ncbi:ubinuclein-1-like isoform X3 [Lingula anatina]|uniref:Ubinuclein-1-like isoform X3 n=1 Tax=Lingula anatina TaxID=7574 RepID=A0A1S3JD88_LINAN|nr:ubinuclein-1-like isoform X3 [Lingula anatina]|eukprot:XP_013408380.1 ubinuclein-1-like isoform X3 [Lingula anatina]